MIQISSDKSAQIKEALKILFFNWLKLSASQLITPLCLLLHPSVELLRQWLFDWRVNMFEEH